MKIKLEIYLTIADPKVLKQVEMAITNRINEFDALVNNFAAFELIKSDF